MKKVWRTRKQEQSRLEEKAEGVKVKKVYTPRFYMMMLSGVASVAGLGLLVLYYFILNIIMGVGGFVMVVAGIFAFRHYWQTPGGISVDHIGGKKSDDSANCLNIYRDRIVFEAMPKPEGFPMLCMDLKKSYYVNIEDMSSGQLMPFILPDQQYYDPDVFAQRVLGLPAHRKIFERKLKLMQKLKTVLLVMAIGIVWLLILTTTGGS